jgi:hypothetical protein
MIKTGLKRHKIGLWWRNEKYKKTVADGDYSPVLESIRNIDCDFFEDSPYNHLDIYRYMEDVRFLMTIREPESWFDSWCANAIREKLINRANSYMDVFYGAKINENNKHIIIDNYNRRNDGIFDYFKGDICTIEIEDDNDIKKDKLSKFLGVDINFEYLHENKRTK